MTRPMQPADLLLYKGKKNLTKAEIEQCKTQEIKAANDKDILLTTYQDLKKNLKRFTLARFLYAQKKYKRFNLLHPYNSVEYKYISYILDLTIIENDEYNCNG